MANPSLQIGNSKWAIKEDNELGYSTAGTRFIPIPITMTRASAGTRVNPQGLVETVDLVIGAEFIVNTNFEVDTGWGGAVSINTTTKQLTKTGGGLGYQITGGIIAGTSYKIVVDVASLDGATTVWVAGNNYNLSVGIQTIYAIGGTNSWNGGRIAINNGYASGTGSVFNSISVKEAAIDDLARVDYDGTVSSLLVEPQRTNLITYSEDFSNAIYIKDSTVSVGTTNNVSPSGESNATKIDVTASGRIYSNFTTDTYVSSIFIKAGTFAYFKLAGAQVDLVAETNANGTIESFGNGWFKVGVNYTGNRPFQIQAYPDGSYATHTTSGNYFIWGSQIEAGSYGTSYISTSGSTVTRVQDQYTKTGISNLINSEEGVLFVELENITGTDATNKMISITDSSTTNKITLFVSSNQISVESAGSGTNLGIYSKALQSGFNKIAIKFKVNDCALWVNGTEYTDTSFAAFSSSTLNSLVFDRGDASQPFYGKVKQLQVFKTALTDDELTILTGTSGVDFYPSYADMASALTYTIQ